MQVRRSTAVAALIGSGLLFVSPASAEWTLTAYMGGAHTFKTSLAITQPASATRLAIHPVTYAAEPFHAPVYYGYRAGYFFSRHFGFDIEFTHLKAYAITNNPAHISGILQGTRVDETSLLNSVVQRFNITHGVNLLTGNFVSRKMLAPRIMLLGRAGAGITVPHPENEVLGVPNAEHYQVGSPAVQLSAGLQIRLLRKLAVLSEFKYTRVNETVGIAQGTGTSLLNSTHMIGGLSWQL